MEIQMIQKWNMRIPQHHLWRTRMFQQWNIRTHHKKRTSNNNSEPLFNFYDDFYGDSNDSEMEHENPPQTSSNIEADHHHYHQHGEIREKHTMAIQMIRQTEH